MDAGGRLPPAPPESTWTRLKASKTEAGDLPVDRPPVIQVKPDRQGDDAAPEIRRQAHRVLFGGDKLQATGRRLGGQTAQERRGEGLMIL